MWSLNAGWDHGACIVEGGAGTVYLGFTTRRLPLPVLRTYTKFERDVFGHIKLGLQTRIFRMGRVCGLVGAGWERLRGAGSVLHFLISEINILPTLKTRSIYFRTTNLIPTSFRYTYTTELLLRYITRSRGCRE